MTQNKAQCTVSLFNFWYQPTTAQLAIVLIYAAEEKEVLLRVRNKPPNHSGLLWYKGEEPGLVVSLVARNTTVTENKDTVVLTCNTNALSIHWLFKGMNLKLNELMKVSEDHRSLTIDPVKREDAGYYWCEISNPVGSTERHVKKPILRASNPTVTENKDAVVLTCYLNVFTIQWLLNGTKWQPTERMKLSKDHQRFATDPVKGEDAGNYQHEASNPISSVASVALELVVKYE
ncbi:cell adhesion molecule CEACAM21-like [Glossophaga mutica]